MKKNHIELQIALDIIISRTHELMDDFRKGKFVFKGECSDELCNICWETVNYIKKINGFALSTYTKSARFWKALLILLNHANFNRERWMKNLQRMIDKMGPRNSCKSYLELMVEIHNWKSVDKIEV